MLPVCKALKEQTNHKIVMLVARINVALAKELAFIDEVIEYSDDTKALIKTIKAHSFDVSISGYIDFTLGKTLFLAGIPKRIAPATKMAQIFFNKRVKQRRSLVQKREFEYNLDLLKAFDASLILDFKRPLLDLNLQGNDFILFHPGFGGSSDGNLMLDDYLRLAKKASEYIDVVFSFGPDDEVSKKYIKEKLDFKAILRDDFKSLMEFTLFIASSKLFVSTSTGPMHLAGMTNTPTLSFFGDALFASAKRWGTVSDKGCQHNFSITKNYNSKVYECIENKLIELIHA
jgi:ADP-heptose:LPS heptosyltransferase